MTFFKKYLDLAINNTYRFYAVKTYDDLYQVVLFNLHKTDMIPLESHKNAQIFLCATGKLTIFINNIEHHISADNNDFIIVPSNAYHKVIAAEDTQGIIVYSPPKHLATYRVD